MSDIVKGVCKEKVPDLVSVHTQAYLGAVPPFSLSKGWFVRASALIPDFILVCSQNTALSWVFCENAARAHAVLLLETQ